MKIIRLTKKAGVNTNKIDPEPYFFRWTACVPLGSKDQPELIGQPCYQHKGCGHLVKTAHDRIPPVVCPWCHKDTKIEIQEIIRAERQGVKIFDFPQAVVNLKKDTFGLKTIARYLRGE